MSDYTPAKNILIIGSSSNLGIDLKSHFEAKGHNVLAPSSSECDITDMGSLLAYIATIPFTLHRVVNLARYTKYSPEDFDSVMVQGVLNLCSWCKSMGIAYAHLSTDQVFDGTKPELYTELDARKPLTRFGGVSDQAETVINSVFSENCRFFIFRLSWTYSNNPCRENQVDLVSALRDFAGDKEIINVPSNIYGNPANTKIIALEIEKILHTYESKQWGVYHIVPFDSCSLYDFAKELFKGEKEVLPVTVTSPEDFPFIENTVNNSTLSPTIVPGVGRLCGSLNCLSWKTHLACYKANSLEPLPACFPNLLHRGFPLTHDGLKLDDILKDMEDNLEGLAELEEDFTYKYSDLVVIRDYYDSVK